MCLILEICLGYSLLFFSVEPTLTRSIQGCSCNGSNKALFRNGKLQINTCQVHFYPSVIRAFIRVCIGSFFPPFVFFFHLFRQLILFVISYLLISNRDEYPTSNAVVIVIELTVHPQFLNVVQKEERSSV